jgi:hypothetical protein
VPRPRQALALDAKVDALICKRQLQLFYYLCKQIQAWVKCASCASAKKEESQCAGDLRGRLLQVRNLLFDMPDQLLKNAYQSIKRNAQYQLAKNVSGCN